MKKPYLLIAGLNYHPEMKVIPVCGGTNCWKGFFQTYEEAKSQVEYELEDYGGGVFNEGYWVNGEWCDWYEIVDLREWTGE